MSTNKFLRLGILLIPTAFIVVGSCDDEDPGTSNASLCDNYCDQLLGCFGETNFDETYSSQGDCEDECAEDIEDIVEDMSSQCESLYRKYLACVYDLSCNDLEDEWAEPGDECSAEWGDLVDDCDAVSTGNCTEENMLLCYDVYAYCVDSLDPADSDYLDDAQECLDTYCVCLDALGCDMTEYEGYCTY